MAYVTLAEAKTYLGTGENGDDDLIQDSIDAAVAFIEATTGRVFEAATATKYYGSEVVYGREVRLDDDLVSVTTLKKPDTDGTEVPEADYWLLPRNEGPPYRRIMLKVASEHDWAFSTDCWIEVAGTWGYSVAPPEDIKRATLVMAAYLYRQKDSQIFDVVAIPGEGIISIPQGVPATVTRIINHYRRRL